MKNQNDIIKENQNEVKNLIEKKENLNSKQKLLEDDMKQTEKKKEEINEESKKIDKEIEDNNPITKEKQKNETFFKNNENEHKRYLYEINKIEKKLKLLKLQYESVTKDISKYEIHH